MCIYNNVSLLITIHSNANKSSAHIAKRYIATLDLLQKTHYYFVIVFLYEMTNNKEQVF